MQWASFNELRSSSTRCEAGGASMALQKDGPVHVGIDNKATVTICTDITEHHKKEENTIIWKQTGLPQWNSLKVGEMPEYSPPACAGSYTSFSFDRDDIFPDLQFYKNFYLSLSGIETDFSTPSSYDFNLRLNFIRYSVGDYFGKHRHGYDNQKYGMILNLSSYDEDIEDLRSGTTVWNSKGEEINTKHTQDVGDLILFNYGCVHEVDKVIKGTRWNVILPNLIK